MIESGPIYTILGCLIAGLIGLLATFLLWERQKKYRRSQIARGFIIEIEMMEKKIENFVEYWRNNKQMPITDVYHFLRVIKQFKSEINEIRPIYPKDGFFYIFQRDIFIFEKELSKALLEFYQNLITAEKCYQELISPKQPNAAQEEKFALNKKIFESLEYAYLLIPYLKTSLSSK
jgi:hypothetical protein